MSSTTNVSANSGKHRFPPIKDTPDDKLKREKPEDEHDLKSSCQYCGRRFKSGVVKYHHVQAVHKGRVAICNTCGKVISYNSRAAHAKTHSKRIVNAF